MPEFESISRQESRYLQTLLRRVEGRIIETDAQEALGNPFPPGSTIAPSNLQVTPGINSIQLRWAASSAKQVRYYDVQFSKSVDFDAPLFQYQTTEIHWNFEEGDPDEEYYARVRVLLGSNQFSQWSPIINTKTGLVLTGDLAPGAATNPVVDRTTSFTPAILDAVSNTSATYGNAEIEIVGGASVVLPFVTFQSEWDQDDDGSLTAYNLRMWLRRDGNRIGDEAHIFVLSSGDGRGSMGGVMAPDEPPDGDRVYDVEIEVDTTGAEYLPTDSDVVITPELLVIELLELRR